jgi:signal transduction histidine kinase
VSDIVQDLEIKVSAAANSKEKISLLNQLASELVQRSESNLPRAIALLEWAQALLHEVDDPSTSAGIFYALGTTYARLGDEQDALEHYSRALSIYRAQGQLEQGSNVLKELSQVYAGLGEYAKALEALMESLEFARQGGSSESQADILLMVSNLHFSHMDYPTAQESAQQSCQLFREVGNAQGEASAQVLLGDICTALGEPEQASNCFQAGYTLSQKSGDQKLSVEVLYKLGEYYRTTNQLSDALAYLRNALELAKQTHHQHFLYQCHRSLSLLYRQMRDFERALLHFEQFFQVKEEVTTLEAQDRQKNMDLLYQEVKFGDEPEIYQLKNVILQEEIRKRQEMERALTQANQQLREEVASRELLIDDLNAFTTMVAHDLKNPLTNLALTAGVLRMSTALANDKVGLDASERLTHQVEKINRIINELLVLASVGKTDFATEPLDMDAIIGEVETRLDRLIKEHRPEIHKPTAWPSACGHAPWVEEVWENYISNAIHYGGNPPIVELGADAPEAGMVRFWVRDNGRGLDEEARSRLFTIFNRNSHSRPTGHGLGLSIVKRIAEKLGGSVGVESEGPGEGSLFYFTLPANLEPDNPPAESD